MRASTSPFVAVVAAAPLRWRWRRRRGRRRRRGPGRHRGHRRPASALTPASTTLRAASTADGGGGEIRGRHGPKRYRGVTSSGEVSGEASASSIVSEHSAARCSRGVGSPRQKPWARSQPIRRRAATSRSSVTPSATTRSPRSVGEVRPTALQMAATRRSCRRRRPAAGRASAPRPGAAQVGERRLAGPEVVDGEADARARRSGRSTADAASMSSIISVSVSSRTSWPGLRPCSRASSVEPRHQVGLGEVPHGEVGRHLHREVLVGEHLDRLGDDAAARAAR